MRGTMYQLFLIALLVMVTAILSLFLTRELYPEYKIYQHAYVNLENFRSSLTHEPPADFELGVKQIVISKSDQGPETIDRCTSCHVALQIDTFSPTKIARDINGDVIRNSEGIPLKIANEQYIFNQLETAIQHEVDPQKRAKLEALKTVDVGGRSVSLSKVLSMHPLLGKELRPFEFHSTSEIGCTACHNGNGRALTAEKAHGPVLDGHYAEAFEGPKQHFTEADPGHEPPFARVFNHKPGHELLFQTTPIFVGGLIQANCVQCHRSSHAQIQGAVNAVDSLNEESRQRATLLATSYQNAIHELLTLFQTQENIESQGVEQTLAHWQGSLKDYTQPEETRRQIAARMHYLQTLVAGQAAEAAKPMILNKIRQNLVSLLGSTTLVDALHDKLNMQGADASATLSTFVNAYEASPLATGRLFDAARAVHKQQHSRQALERAQNYLDTALESEQAILSDIDFLTPTYREGKQEFQSQACYACHRISGFSRGGVGPELTQSGYSYPWFLKQKLVWPQGDLKTSTMPNMRLDHTQLEALMTFLLAQKGQTKAISELDHQINIKQWELGKKLPWEEALAPALIHNLDNSMTIFASEGCAACHRLKGFTSDVGYAIERESQPTFAALMQEREWFRRLIPELVGGIDIPGSLLVNQLEQHAEEIDRRIVNQVRQGSLLERIESRFPGLLESFYSNFAYARRHQDGSLEGEALKQWQDRVRRILMIYIQEYGLGRLIGPRPNWSGIYRSDEWLMEHFREPSALMARSLMPVFPFDITKFAALTYMLDELGKRNLDFMHKVWDLNGFNPEEAYHIHCSQCHGIAERREEAPVAQWIYPIPKNLRNAFFLSNLTRPRIIESVTHGVKGTPMPPWGETPKGKPFLNDVPVLRPNEVAQLTDWLLRLVPESDPADRGELVPKWRYGPQDVLHELKQEGDSQLFRNLAGVTPSAVVDLFDTAPDPNDSHNTAYTIKREYFTPDHIEEGQRLFMLNCAVCHGNEGGGDGARASEMSDAKPRMFTNAIWGRTRDDLRLLRSIKYGVAGTSMVPWGDMTSTLQRLQLAIYIRHLSEDIDVKNALSTALYEAFDSAIDVIRNAQILEYAKVDEAKRNYDAAKENRLRLDSQVGVNPALADDAVKAYEQEIKALGRLNQTEAGDQHFLTLLNLVTAERTLYERGGKALLNAHVNHGLFTTYLDLIHLNDHRYQVHEGQLRLSTIPEDQWQIATAKFLSGFDHTDPAQEKLRNELISLLAEAARLRDKQKIGHGHVK